MIYVNHLVLVQGTCLFAWVKLLGVIQFLHLLAMEEISMVGIEGG